MTGSLARPQAAAAKSRDRAYITGPWSASPSPPPPFEAIAATLPLGSSVGYESEPDARGERWIWLEPRFVDRVRALRGPGESYSGVILRLAQG
jgi:hypothetical protein